MSSRNSRGRRKNRSRFSVLFKLLAVAALVAALTFGVTVFFQVERVVVTGNSRYTAQEIEAASGIELGDNLFRINKYQIRTQILQQLPYVESLTIRRGLPSTILIEVTEWDAVAQVQTVDKPWLISVGGKVLEPAADSAAMVVTGLSVLAPQAGLPLAVPQEQQTRLAGLLDLLSALEEREILGQVSAVDLSSGTGIVLRYGGRFDVKLPINGDFVYKLRALEAAVADREDYETGTMDLTRQDYTVVYSPNP